MCGTLIEEPAACCQRADIHTSVCVCVCVCECCGTRVEQVSDKSHGLPSWLATLSIPLSHSLSHWLGTLNCYSLSFSSFLPLPLPSPPLALPISLACCAGYFNFRLKVCNKLKGLHKVYAMLHTVRRATSRSAGNLKQQDKCDNLSAFWPVASAAAAARTKRTGAATSSPAPAPAPTPWHATTNSHKLLVLQQRERETQRGSVWHILHSIKLMSSKMEKQQRQQQAVAINACHAPPSLLGTPPGHGTASASAKNCCKMMWVVACCGRRCCSCNFCCIFSSSVASNLLL